MFQLLRVKQYAKNLLIFAPIFFAASITNLNYIYQLIIVFIGFSLSTSFIYILNDIHDKDADKLHETKFKRPVASGKISVKKAFIIAILCLLTGLCLYHSKFVFIYLFLNLLYTYKLKNYALLDIIIISLGYIIRLFIGSEVTNIILSPWIIIMTFLLALFLAAAKRYDDLNYEKSVRENIRNYNKPYIESIMSIMAAIIVIAYIIYTLSPEVTAKFNCQYLYITSVFVLIGILRYLQITFVFKQSGSPTNIIYSDWFIKITVFLWIVSYICIIYL